MILVAASITITLRIVGVLLVSSLIAIPVATSLKVAKSFKNAMLYSVLFGEIAIISGVISSFYLDLAPGGTIVIISVAQLLIVSILSKVINKNKIKMVIK
jgi:zinc transport system permease protein